MKFEAYSYNPFSGGAFLASEKNKLAAIKKAIVAEINSTIISTNWLGAKPYTTELILSIPEYTITSSDDININIIYNHHAHEFIK